MLPVYVLSSDQTINAVFAFSRVPCRDEFVNVPSGMGDTICHVRTVLHYADADANAQFVARIEVDVTGPATLKGLRAAVATT